LSAQKRLITRDSVSGVIPSFDAITRCVQESQVRWALSACSRRKPATRCRAFCWLMASISRISVCRRPDMPRSSLADSTGSRSSARHRPALSISRSVERVRHWHSAS